MLKALIITYYWPPSGGSGVQRWLYFAKYMKENGIEPIILTIDPKQGSFPAIDQSLLRHTEGIRVEHTNVVSGFHPLKIYSYLKSGNEKGHIPIGDFGNKKKTFLDKIAGFIRANYFIPDARVGWNKQAIRLANSLLKNEKIDLLITTGPPHSTHLIGLELKKNHSIHWVSDFRDPWREVYYNNLFKRTKASDRKDKQLELDVIHKADTILTVGPSMKNLLMRKVPLQPDKFFAILNGFDSEVIASLQPIRYKEYTIAHIGIWTLQQAHTELVQALSEILGSENKKQIRFVVVGKVDPTIITQLKGIPNLILDIRGQLDHQSALQEMMNADLLINCLAQVEDAKILISGKLMEYLASGNRVLAIGDTEGDAAFLMGKFKHTRIIEPGNSQEIKKCIFEWINEKRDRVHSELIQNYSRKETAKQLAKLLKNRIHVS